MNKSNHVENGPGVSKQAAPEWAGDKPKAPEKAPRKEDRTEEDRTLRQDVSRPFKGVGSI
jgi:hypothetical protein